LRSDAVAVTWVARLFIAIGVGIAVFGGRSGLETYSFISESVLAEGTVVDWSQGTWQTGRSREPGAYYPVIEVLTHDGARLVGEAETGVGMNQLTVGEKLPVRYRSTDSTRMRVASLSGLWLKEMVFALLAIAFCTSGTVLLKQARKEARRPGWPDKRLQ
jgi:Protein of unknown function (DUF3592)